MSGKEEVELLLEKLREFTNGDGNADAEKARDVVIDIAELLSTELSSIEYGEKYLTVCAIDHP